MKQLRLIAIIGVSFVGGSIVSILAPDRVLAAARPSLSSLDAAISSLESLVMEIAAGDTKVGRAQIADAALLAVGVHDHDLPPSLVTRGSLRFDAANLTLELFDGVEWKVLAYQP